MTQELRGEILLSRSSRDEALKRISEKNEKFASIDIEDLKASECNQKFPLTIVDSIHARFQDSIESIKQKVKTCLASSQGDVSLCLFDSILGGNKASWDKDAWVEKDFEEALTFVEVRYVWEDVKDLSLKLLT